MAFLTENEQRWSNIITEEYGVKDQNKLEWMSKLAQVHAIHEGVQGGNAGVASDSSIYATPFSTLGIGNPMMPTAADGYKQGKGFGNDGYDFAKQNVGSGDIPMSTLTMALEVAAMTIGLELVPVIPASGPWAMLSYMDFPYAGGKLGKINETAFDGKGEGDQNKPIYIKLDVDYGTDGSSDDASVIADLRKINPFDASVEVGGLAGQFIGTSRIDGGLIIKVDSCAKNAEGKDQSIIEVLTAAAVGANVTITSTTGAVITGTLASIKPELVTSAADHVQRFANFIGDSDDPMTRAENEAGTGNRIGARMFTKMVQMRSYEVTGSVTRQQLQDMPLYGVDVIGKVLEHMQNEISQAINNRILDRVFKLGVENAVNQYKYQGVNLNLWMDPAAAAGITKPVAQFACADKLVGLDGKSAKNRLGSVVNGIGGDTFDNVTTRQRRIMSRLLAAANLIANVSRRGRGQWAVTNTQVLTALQDAANFVVAPMVNTLTQDGSQSLYFAGSVAGINLYVDPYMKWDDTRVCVGRKSNGSDPGVVFMPYILADTVQVTAEGTFAPVLLCNSRYALVDAGFYPEQSYYTFAIESAGGLLV